MKDEILDDFGSGRSIRTPKQVDSSFPEHQSEGALITGLRHMPVNEKLWPSRKSEGADISTIEELAGIDLTYGIKEKREKIGRVELGLVRIPIFWEWIDPVTGKDTSQINYYINSLNVLIDMRNRVDANHETLVQRVIPDFHIIRDDDVVMGRTAVIKQREPYEELRWQIRIRAFDEDFVRKLIPDFDDRLDGMYETGENRNWATDQQKMINMLTKIYNDWISEIGRVYLDYLTDGGLDARITGLTPGDATRCERWIHDVGESYMDHLDITRTVKQNYDWLLDRKIPTVVRRFERLIEKEAKFVGRVDGEPMVDRKTRVRRSMLAHWVDKFYRKMRELNKEEEIYL